MRHRHQRTIQTQYSTPDPKITSAFINNQWKGWLASKLKYLPPSITELSPVTRRGNCYKRDYAKQRGSRTALSRCTSKQGTLTRQCKELMSKSCRGTSSTLWAWAGKCNSMF